MPSKSEMNWRLSVTRVTVDRAREMAQASDESMMGFVEGVIQIVYEVWVAAGRPTRQAQTVKKAASWLCQDLEKQVE